jgi:hypothetical protein
MEITAELADWNSKTEYTADQYTGAVKKKVTGVKIKGYIQLGKMILERSSAKAGLYSLLGEGVGDYSYTPYGANFISPSVVFRTKRRTIGFDEQGRQLWDSLRLDAGQIEWEVELSEANAKNKPVSFKDVKLVDGGVDGRWEPNTIIYISDFVVTDVIMP